MVDVITGAEEESSFGPKVSPRLLPLILGENVHQSFGDGDAVHKQKLKLKYFTRTLFIPHCLKRPSDSKMGPKTGFGACSRVKAMKVLLLMAIYLSGLTFADKSEEEMTESQEIDDEEDDDRHLRLPDVVTPNHYQITLLPILDKDPRLCGHVWITVTVQYPTKAIILNAFQLIPVEVVVQAESVALNNTETKRKVEDTCFFGGDDDDDEDYFSDDNEDEDANHVRNRKKIRNDMVEDLHLDDDEQRLVVILKDVLQVGDVYRVGILYHAEIYDGENIGFFRLENKLNKNDCCEK